MMNAKDIAAMTHSLSKEEMVEMSDAMCEIFSEFARLRGELPKSQIVQAAMEKFYHFLNNNFGYHYSMEAFAGLGRMYAEDERYTKNIDQFGAGLANFLAESMTQYAKSN